MHLEQGTTGSRTEMRWEIGTLTPAVFYTVLSELSCPVSLPMTGVKSKTLVQMAEARS